MGKNSEIRKQLMVKFWFHWSKDGAVSYSISCINSKLPFYSTQAHLETLQFRVTSLFIFLDSNLFPIDKDSIRSEKLSEWNFLYQFTVGPTGLTTMVVVSNFHQNIIGYFLPSRSVKTSLYSDSKQLL